MKEIKMSDVGTRLEHLIDLYELWSEGVRILEVSENLHETLFGQTQLNELRTAKQFLWWHMEKDYDRFQYSTVIDRMPKASGITGGRGEELDYHDNIT